MKIANEFLGVQEQDLELNYTQVAVFNPNPKTDYAFRFISYAGVKLWNNEIPIKIKQISTYKAFAKAMHNHLINTN